MAEAIETGSHWNDLNSRAIASGELPIDNVVDRVRIYKDGLPDVWQEVCWEAVNAQGIILFDSGSERESYDIDGKDDKQIDKDIKERYGKDVRIVDVRETPEVLVYVHPELPQEEISERSDDEDLPDEEALSTGLSKQEQAARLEQIKAEQARLLEERAVSPDTQKRNPQAERIERIKAEQAELLKKRAAEKAAIEAARREVLKEL